MVVSKGVGVIGSRSLPVSYRAHVQVVVTHLVERGYLIHSGGAVGADQFALESVFSLGASAQAVLFSAWQSVSGFPRAVQPSVHQLIAYGGSVVWGVVSPRASGRGVVVAGLLARNCRLVGASVGIIAFLHGTSRGSRRTISEAVRRGRRVVVFLCGGASLPSVRGGSWVQLGGSSPFSGAFMFLPKVTTAQRQPTSEASGAVREFQEVH